MIKQVKRIIPSHFLIYKLHPDLESGLRTKDPKESKIKNIAGLLAYKTSLEDVLVMQIKLPFLLH